MSVAANEASDLMMILMMTLVEVDQKVVMVGLM